MKLTWKNKNKDNKKRPLGALSVYPDLPFDKQSDKAEANTTLPHQENGDDDSNKGRADVPASDQPLDSSDVKRLAEAFQAQGNKLAEAGKYREALGKWETALTLMPQNATLHEQKAQILLEIGDAWSALKAASRATELEPSWAEAWITLGRAQLNFGEPDSAIQSFDRALAIKPDSKEVQDDRSTALHLVKRRKQLHLSGLSCTTNRYVVGDKSESS
ncbi:N-terminal acetyltransferase A, auxiliary subunit [Parasponia andersonii]|uniref:N-terminal acetyltransferase A, auxiliary subunit n=1 Tax=Parasponia andersonii TaxID=3476 RepID=A0A2P5CGF8_PARAD|nr:N-terminal acetyltransferase A, auxiliary subunit [Parasponia andersonii]